MVKRFPFQIAGLSLDGSLPVPLYQQLYENFRELILNGRLQAGQRLPSSRSLTKELGISRNTVSLAFERLFSEGYVYSKTGSGTFVGAQLPDDLLRTEPKRRKLSGRPARGRIQLSKLGTVISKSAFSADTVLRPFQHGIPAVTEFPVHLWNRLGSRIWRAADPVMFGYAHPAGHPPLRKAVAEYLRTARAVNCTQDQVLIVSGSQQALDLSSRILLDPGDRVWIEDPGYKGARSALGAAGAQLVPVPVDDHGLAFDAGRRKAPDARMAYATPSHQFPLGVTMSLPRRLQLLEWAALKRAWILEDDYDSEYRYGERPLASLQGLDRHSRVIYIGSFSKVLVPALRLGYIVVPKDLIEVFTSGLALTHRHVSTMDQAILAAFIAEGHFGRHIRRMRVLYEARQKTLVDAVNIHLTGVLKISGSNAGMHLVAWLKKGAEFQDFSRIARESGVFVTPLSTYAASKRRLNGVVMGYTAFRPDEIVAAILKLHAAFGK